MPTFDFLATIPWYVWLAIIGGVFMLLTYRTKDEPSMLVQAMQQLNRMFRDRASFNRETQEREQACKKQEETARAICGINNAAQARGAIYGAAVYYAEHGETTTAETLMATINKTKRETAETTLPDDDFQP